MPALTKPDSRVYDDQRSSTARRYAIKELVRVEFGRLLVHPTVLAGAVLSGLLLWTLNAGQLPELGRFSTSTGLGLSPLAAAAVMAAHLNTSRARRDDTDMAFAALSLSPTHRALGHLVAAAAPAVLAAAMTVAYFAVLLSLGSSGSIWMAEAAVGVTVVWVGGVAGTATGVWIPSRWGGLLAVVAVGAFQVVLHEMMPGTLHWLALWRTVSDHVGSDLWIRPSTSHLLYLLALAGLVSAVALYRSAPRAGGVTAVVAGVAVVATGASQLAPPSEQQVESVFAQLEAGEQFHDCDQRDTVEYCLFSLYAGWAGYWHPLAVDVLEPVPDQHRPNLVVSQRRDAMPQQLIDELTGQRAEAATVRGEELRLARAPGHTGEQADGRPIRVGEIWMSRPADDLSFAVAVAQRAVGLPTDMTLVEPPRDDGAETMPAQPGMKTDTPLPDKQAELLPVACHAEGQARAVVALWLASHSNGLDRALPQADVNAALLLETNTSDGQSYRYVQWAHYDPTARMTNGMTMPGSSSVKWGQADLHLTHQLLALPAEQVTAAVADNWTAWTDPAISSEVLVDHFGLQAPPSVNDQLAALGLDPAEHPEIVDAYPNEHHLVGTFSPSPQMPTCS